MNAAPGIQNLNTRIQSSGANWIDRFQHTGFEIIDGLLSVAECDSLALDLTRIFEEQQQSTRSKLGGVRNLLHSHPIVSELAHSKKVRSLIAEACGEKSAEKFLAMEPFPVRAIFFDKNPESNWLVPWHQDLAIAVTNPIETPGFTGWSVKEGVHHVHPPREILEGMVTLRLHLDDCLADNGALKVISGSHQHGKLDAAQIAQFTKSNESVVCEITQGSALLMRPLILHSSLPAKNPSHRRVLHLEYAACELPNGLSWLKN